MDVIHWLDPSDINFGALTGTIVVLAVAVTATTLVKRYIGKLLDGAKRHFSISYETSLIITRSARAAVWIIAAMLILNLWGIGMGGLWTLLVSTTAVVGVGFLAVWTIISNVTASLFLTIWRPFHLGQTVEILPDGVKGRAVSRDMMFTALHEESGSTLQIPNNIFFQRMFRVSGTPGPLRTGHPENGGEAKTGGAAPEA